MLPVEIDRFLDEVSAELGVAAADSLEAGFAAFTGELELNGGEQVIDAMRAVLDQPRTVDEKLLAMTRLLELLGHTPVRFNVRDLFV